MNRHLRISIIAAIGLLVACGGDPTEPSGFVWPANTAEAVATHTEIVEATYSDAIVSGMALSTSLANFTEDPSLTTFLGAQTSWLNSRPRYVLTEAFRFYGGPIDGVDEDYRALIDAWPVTPSYIDYAGGDAGSGIVNGDETIDAATLESLNGVGGPESVSVGYHAVEFLLYGEDADDAGPGQRPYTDYVTDGSGTAQNQDRRAQYLVVASELIPRNLRHVHESWTEGAVYRTEFEEDAEGSFEKALTGLVGLTAHTGGWLTAALSSGSQADESSQFSDNTHVDLVQGITGIRNVWQGSFTRADSSTVEGTGLRDVVAAVDAELAASLDSQIDESLAAANAIVAPFDQEIVAGAEGNARVQALIDSLAMQESLLDEVFVAFQLRVLER